MCINLRFDDNNLEKGNFHGIAFLAAIFQANLCVYERGLDPDPAAVLGAGQPVKLSQCLLRVLRRQQSQGLPGQNNI